MILSLKWDHCLLLWFVLMCSPSVVDIVHTFGCNKSEVPTHTHTHTVCSVFCVYGSVCVTHGHIWISKSVCVCLCQGSVWAFELFPSCVASHGCPMGTLSSSIWLMSEWNQTGRREEKKKRKKRGGKRGDYCENKSQHSFCVLFIHQNGAVSDSVSSSLTCWVHVCKCG